MCEIWGNFEMKIWYFVNNCFIKFESKNPFAHNYVLHIVIICRTPHFISTFVKNKALVTSWQNLLEIEHL